MRSSTQSLRRIAAPVLLTLFFAATWSSPLWAADVHTRVELENDRTKLIFLRGKKKATDPVGGIGMTQIINKLNPNNSNFNTIFSPMFQVELRSSSDPAGFPPIMIPDGVLEFVLLPIEQTILEQVTPNTASLTWLNIEVPGTTQLLNAQVTCRLRFDEMAEWSFNMQVTDGPYWIYAVRCPYLGFKEIDTDSTDDTFLIPMTGGQIVPDPLTNGNNHPERDPQEGRVKDAFFTYPGNVFTQFMAYYDPTMGFYLAADDQVGNTKNLYFNTGSPLQSPQKIRVYQYITHFNRGRKPLSGETQADIELDLRSFDLGLNLGYNVLTDVFVGDWVDATQKYRNWAIENNVPFIGRGTLIDRTDLDTSSKATTYIIRWGLPHATDEIDPVDQYNKIQQTLLFLNLVRRRYDPLETVDFLPFILLGSYALGPIGPTTDGHDDISYPLRVGVPELIDALRNPTLPGQIRARSVSMNRDTTGIAIDANVVNTGLKKGIMVQPDLTHMLANNIRYRSCVGAEWLRDHRIDLILQTMTDSQITPGSGGFNAVATTGTGNLSFVCYAPMIDDPLIIDRNCHNHTIGGGNYQTTGWIRFASDLRTEAGKLGNAPLLLGMEHSPETMLRDFLLTGRSFAPPFDESLDGVFRTIDNADPVPLFAHLYHDFSLQPSKPPSVTKAVELYVDEDNSLEDLLILRLRYAQLSMDGRLLRTQIGQEDPAEANLIGPIQNLDPELQDEQVFLSALSTLKGSASEHLIFGEALRTPILTGVSATDSTDIRFKLFGNETTQSTLRVVGSAWREKGNGNIGFYLVNFTPTPAFVTLSFDPIDYNVDPAGTYIVEERIDISTWEDTGYAFDPTQPFVSPNLRIQPLENASFDPPWRIFRLRNI